MLVLVIFAVKYGWTHWGVIEVVKEVPNFDSVYTGGLMNVYLEKGDHQGVTLRIDEKFIEQAKIEVIDGELRIYTEGHMQGERVTDAYVTYTSLKKLKADDASTLTSLNQIKAKDLSLLVDGAAELKVNLRANKLRLDMNGNANVQLAGKTKKFEFYLNHVGDLMAYNLESDTCVARIITGDQSPGVARVHVLKSLDALIDGPRYLYYKGEPHLANVQFDRGGRLLKE